MKNSFYTDVHSSKPFRKLDVFIYSIVALTVIILFLIFVIFPKTNSASGFEILLNQTKVLSHEYNTDKFSISDGFSDSVTVTKTQDGYLITVRTEKGYNVIFSNEENHSVSVKESDCSTSPDCKYSPSVSDSGVIICVPHGLKIQPLKSGGFTPPVAG